jgi:hypothetical protein
LWEAIEADLFALGLTIDDVPGRFSWRAFRNWLRFAPRESAAYRQAFPDAPWSPLETRVADIADLLNGLIWVTKRAHFDKVGDPPEPLPRPGDVKPEPAKPRKSYTTAEIDALMARIDEADRAGTRNLTNREVVT